MAVTKPAAVDWKRIHRVAVLKFDGPYGETVRHHVFDRLAQVQHFTSTDTRYFRALAETPYEKVQDASFLNVLKHLHVDIVLGGLVTAETNDVPGSEQVQLKEGTGYYKKEKNIYGQWVDVEIKRTVMRDVPCVIRHASLTTEYKVFDLKTNRIIAAGQLTENYNKKFGGHKPYASLGHKVGDLPPPSTTMDELSAGLVIKLVAELSRIKLASMVSLDDSGNSMVRQGVALAREGAWGDAMQLWQEVIGSEPTNPAAHYNLGVAYEGLGDLESLRAAMSFYETAARYGDKGLYADGIARVKRVIQQSDNH
jgi:tetratricopeptide (TPR) repeat protein